MEINQDKLRERVLKRCLPQKVIAQEVGLTNIYFNYWLKSHRELGPNAIDRIEKWLEK